MTEPNPIPLTTTAAQGPNELDALDAIDDAQPTQWKPQHLGHAAWLARIYKQSTKTLGALVEQFDAEVADILARKKTAVARHTRRIEWAERLLIAYAAEHGDEGRLDLPHATISARMNPISIVVDNADDAIAWLVSHGFKDSVKIEMTVKVADIKRAALSYGQLDALDKSKLVAVGAADGPVLVPTVDPETGEVEPQAIPGLIASRRIGWTVTT